MIYISLPDNKQRRLTFYLAMEEYVALMNCDKDCFFMWQVEPSVIFGRHQLIQNEVNTEYCKAHNIEIYRRRSGGGCVYADKSNIMMSYITKDENVNFTFNKYINLIVLALYKLGIDCKANGRNDIFINGKKVSGNAFYHFNGKSIVHGTMLYDTNMQNMIGSITPSVEKLESKGVESVRQHITLLKDYISLSIDDFKKHMESVLCDEKLILTSDDVKQIEEIEKKYASKDFIYGHSPNYNLKKSARIENVGNIEVQMKIKNETIKDIKIAGDYFPIGNIDNIISKPLQNIHLERNAISMALPKQLDNAIMNLNKNDFIDLILK